MATDDLGTCDRTVLASKGGPLHVRTPLIVSKPMSALLGRDVYLYFDNDVKVRTDPDLAHILEVVEVDCEIPLQAFAAVAEILTYVYRMNGALPAAREPS